MEGHSAAPIEALCGPSLCRLESLFSVDSILHLAPKHALCPLSWEGVRQLSSSHLEPLGRGEGRGGPSWPLRKG